MPGELPIAFKPTLRLSHLPHNCYFLGLDSWSPKRTTDSCLNTSVRGASAPAVPCKHVGELSTYKCPRAYDRRERGASAPNPPKTPPQLKFISLFGRQVCKSGTLHRDTTYPAPLKFLVEGKWLVDWWRKNKMGPEKCIQQLVYWKVANCEKWVKEVNYREQKHMELQGDAERFGVREHLMKAFKKFQRFPAIERWRTFYKRAQWGRHSRFRFLVLVGRSKLGKTNLALSLFGIHYTYVSNAQGCQEPYILGYSKRFHRAILLDECSPDMVRANKQLFQANSDGAFTGFSKTGCYTKFHWLYQVPLIISTNTWLSEAEKKLPENEWLVENSVVVTITEPCYVSTPELSSRPATAGS